MTKITEFYRRWFSILITAFAALLSIILAFDIATDYVTFESAGIWQYASALTREILTALLLATTTGVFVRKSMNHPHTKSVKIGVVAFILTILVPVLGLIYPHIFASVVAIKLGSLIITTVLLIVIWLDYSNTPISRSFP